MPMRDMYLLLGAGVLAVGAAIAATSFIWYGVLPFAIGAAVIAAAALWHSRRAPHALLVGPAYASGMGSFENALGNLGYRYRRCPGPAVNDCPVFAGDTCPYTNDYKFALVVDSAEWANAPCGRALAISEHRVDEASMAGTGAVDTMKSLIRFARTHAVD